MEENRKYSTNLMKFPHVQFQQNVWNESKNGTIYVLCMYVCVYIYIYSAGWKRTTHRQDHKTRQLAGEQKSAGKQIYKTLHTVY